MKWISVKDRLPEVKQRVLLFTEGEAIEGWLTDVEGVHWYFITLSIHGCGCCGEDDDEVTHWMPLPEPPERKQDDVRLDYQNEEGK